MSVPTISPDDAQRQAADPSANVWVSASAGSGKTKVLTDRVLTLLLSGTPPHRILCLTFTKAAAAEMANRINDELSFWTVSSDKILTDRLSNLLAEQPDVDRVRAARRLFAEVLDTPGGLKIQTIHSFCESLLARFPVESGLTPQTKVMDERSAAEHMQSSRDTVLIAAQRIPALAEALAEVTSQIQEDQFTRLMSEISRERGRLSQLLIREGGYEGATAAIYKKFGVPPDLTVSAVIEAACSEASFDGEALQQAAEALLGGTGATDKRSGNTIVDWLATNARSQRTTFDAYVDVFLTKEEREPRIRLATKGVINAFPEIDNILRAEATRLAQCHDEICTISSARSTAALLHLGIAMVEAYRGLKSARMQLDYDDLIYGACDLLTNRDMTPWVLFKLDGGLDHILVDESQDTNPEQWEIMRAIADEFFAGEGARADTVRTVFAVGDKKQSIFSFQRADPELGDLTRDHLQLRAQSVSQPWRSIQLDTSFRSTDAVLKAVDAVFHGDTARLGVVDASDKLQHNVHRRFAPGRVELWPVVQAKEQSTAQPWEPPVVRRHLDDPESRLASVIAAKIRSWINHETLTSKDGSERAIKAGDIMILVRRRRRIVDRLVRSLKDAGVPVAGVDRLVLTQQLSVMDLVAFANFLLLPDDDLNLATVLKGPLVGFDDDDLFELAFDRGKKSLWQVLVDRASDIAKFERARLWLGEMLGDADFVAPYELFAGVLTRPTVNGESGRKAMVSRLGAEAEDPLDEFLNLALDYEHSETPSLQGFLHWIAAEETEVKRDLEQNDRDEVRVMTVHGAKGLQAPIVILADTLSAPRGSTPGGAPIRWSDDGVPLWSPRKSLECSITKRAREKAARIEQEEYHRLLYVAMTRAEDRLYVAGAQRRATRSPDCWYNLIHEGLTRFAAPEVFDFTSIASEGWTGDGLVYSTEPVAITDSQKTFDNTSVEPGFIPQWIFETAPDAPTPSRPITATPPSTGAPNIRSPLTSNGENRFQRGLLVHRLLELLPPLQPEVRIQAARKFLSQPLHGLDTHTCEALISEVMKIFEHIDFQSIFGVTSRAEVALVGRVSFGATDEIVSGQVDRMVVTDREVYVIDYKTMRQVPATAEAAPKIYLRQLAIYRALLHGVWPERAFKSALLWTEGPVLMPICEALLDRHTPTS